MNTQRKFFELPNAGQEGGNYLTLAKPNFLFLVILSHYYLH